MDQNQRYHGAISLIKSQTNYTVEEAKIKLEEHDGNYMNVIKEYLNPEAAVNELRQKLMRVGINFGDVQFTGEEGEISVPLVKHGGVYGKDTDSAPEEVVNETESGRSINFVYEKLATGTHKVFAQIS